MDTREHLAVLRAMDLMHPFMMTVDGEPWPWELLPSPLHSPSPSPETISAPDLELPATTRPSETAANRRCVRATSKVVYEQSRRIANAALDYYNNKRKIKFELLASTPAIGIPEFSRSYTHINFIAKSSKEGSQPQLFFAELYYCGKRRSSSGFSVTYCEPLGSDCTVGQKGIKDDCTSKARKNMDFSHCFACGQDKIHPKGENYIAGHCNIYQYYASPMV